MSREAVPRRATLAGLVTLGVGGLFAHPTARQLLDALAPLSGSFWDAVGRELPETVESPYGEATIRLNEQAVPHVEAGNEQAAYFAVGFMHGFDRLFQLEMVRAMLRGELAAVAGESELQEDRFHRMMDFVSAAEATAAELEGTETGACCAAYAAGVNEAIETTETPPELTILGVEPTPWTVTDTVLVEKRMAWEIGGRLTPLHYAGLAAELSHAELEAVAPLDLDHDAAVLPTDGTPEREVPAPTGPALKELLAWVSDHEGGAGTGGNVIAVGGAHTPDGTPRLAHDPHLDLMAPPLLYEQVVSLPEYTAGGVTFPGIPFVTVGASDAGMWSFSNAAASTVACYHYEVDGNQYRYGDEWRTFDTTDQEIAVSGGEDVSLTTKRTIHGPYLEAGGEGVAVAWTGLTATRTLAGLRDLARARSVSDALEAASLIDDPAQHLVYAGSDQVGYRLTGRLPERDRSALVTVFDGSAGEGEWDGYSPYGDSSWEGFVPAETMPEATDLEVAVAADQRVMDGADPVVGGAAASPFRANRIRARIDEWLAAGDTIDSEQLRILQTDRRDRRAATLVPELLSAVADQAVDDAVQQAAERLEAWDHEMAPDSEAALLFDVWMQNLRWHVEHEVRQRDTEPWLRIREWTIATLPPASPFWGEPGRAGRFVIALEQAIDRIDDAGWTVLGDRQTTERIDHPADDMIEEFGYPTEPVGGSRHTVNRFGRWTGSGYRLVGAVGDDPSTVIAGGNAGNPMGEHFDDQLEDWLAGDLSELSLDPEGTADVSFVPEI